MPKRNMNEHDPLEDFDPREITLDGVAKVVHVAGAGPAMIVMTEMPGISPHVARFSRWVRDAGFTAYMPLLFGRDGAVPNVEEGTATFQRACVSAEFRAFAANESSPVTRWLRSLARLAHQECGGPGVGAIGMCFTTRPWLLIKRILVGLLASAGLACASRAPLALHGEIAFPRPDRETCASGVRTPYRLSVRVRDEQGASFPGAHVYLFPMGPGAEALVTARANESGVAIAVATPPGVYAVVAAVGGFEPQVRALTMRGGCSGSATFTLKLGPVAVER